MASIGKQSAGDPSRSFLLDLPVSASLRLPPPVAATLPNGHRPIPAIRASTQVATQCRVSVVHRTATIEFRRIGR